MGTSPAEHLQGIFCAPKSNIARLYWKHNPKKTPGKWRFMIFVIRYRCMLRWVVGQQCKQTRVFNACGRFILLRTWDQFPLDGLGRRVRHCSESCEPAFMHIRTTKRAAVWRRPRRIALKGDWCPSRAWRVTWQCTCRGSHHNGHEVR
jgi:hypothetical protein